MKHDRKSDLSDFVGLRGVYYLFDDKDNIIYIGCSVTIGNRIKAHKKGKNKPYKPFKFFAFTETDGDIYKLEAIEINRLKPSLNIVIPKIKELI